MLLVTFVLFVYIWILYKTVLPIKSRNSQYYIRKAWSTGWAHSLKVSGEYRQRPDLYLTYCLTPTPTPTSWAWANKDLAIRCQCQQHVGIGSGRYPMFRHQLVKCTTGKALLLWHALLLAAGKSSPVPFIFFLQCCIAAMQLANQGPHQHKTECCFWNSWDIQIWLKAGSRTG